MVEGNADAVRLLGLPGFVLLDVHEIDAELELLVETDDTVVGCRGCGVRAVSHGRRSTVVRDLPIAGRAVRLRWRKRLWRCHEDLCPTTTWTEQHPAIPPRAVMTERARTEVCRQVGQDGDAVAADVHFCEIGEIEASQRTFMFRRYGVGCSPVACFLSSIFPSEVAATSPMVVHSQPGGRSLMLRRPG